jgi:hypothetical protein
MPPAIRFGSFFPTGSSRDLLAIMCVHRTGKGGVAKTKCVIAGLRISQPPALLVCTRITLYANKSLLARTCRQCITSCCPSPWDWLLERHIVKLTSLGTSNGNKAQRILCAPLFHFDQPFSRRTDALE